MGMFGDLFDAAVDAGTDLMGGDWDDATSWLGEQVSDFAGDSDLVSGALGAFGGGGGGIFDTITSGGGVGGILDGLTGGGGFGGIVSSLGEAAGGNGGFFGGLSETLDQFGGALGGDSMSIGGIVGGIGSALGGGESLGSVGFLGGLADDLLPEGVDDIAGSLLGGGGLGELSESILGTGLGEIGNWDSIADGLQTLDLDLPDGIVDLGGDMLEGMDLGSVMDSGFGGISDQLEGAFGGLGAEQLGEMAGSLLGDAGIDLPDSADSLISAISGGGVSDLLDQFGGEGLSGLVHDLTPTGAQELLDKAGDVDGLDDVFGGLTGTSATELIGKVTGGGGLDDVVNGLSETGAKDLLTKLLSEQQDAPSPGDPGTGIMPPDLGGDDITIQVPEADQIDLVTMETQIEMEPGTGIVPELDDITMEDPLVADVAAPVDTPDVMDIPEPPPVPDEFDQQVEAADVMEDSVDDLFEGLE